MLTGFPLQTATAARKRLDVTVNVQYTACLDVLYRQIMFDEARNADVYPSFYVPVRILESFDF